MFNEKKERVVTMFQDKNYFPLLPKVRITIGKNWTIYILLGFEVPDLVSRNVTTNIYGTL